MNQLNSFMVTCINGGFRVSLTYDVVNDTTGAPISQNKKDGFYVVDEEIAKHLEAVQKYIKENKLTKMEGSV